jgi:hypothetical protein
MLNSFIILSAQINQIKWLYDLEVQARLESKLTNDVIQLKKFYEELFKVEDRIFVTIDKNYVNNITRLYEKNESQLALKIFEKRLNLGLNTELIQSYLKNESFKTFFNEPKVKELMFHYDSFNQNYLSKLDVYFFAEISSLYNSDQFVRDLNYSNIAFEGIENGEIEEGIKNKYLELMDSLNAEYFLELIQEKGFPTFDQVGVNSVYFIVLMHNFSNCNSYNFKGVDYFMFMDSCLKSNVILGNFSNKNYSFLVDRSRLHKCGTPGYYGSGYTLMMNDPIGDLEDIDQRRAEIFLPPLWVDLFLNDLSVPEGYVLPKEAERYFK